MPSPCGAIPALLELLLLSPSPLPSPRICGVVLPGMAAVLALSSLSCCAVNSDFSNASIVMLKLCCLDPLIVRVSLLAPTDCITTPMGLGMLTTAPAPAPALPPTKPATSVVLSCPLPLRLNPVPSSVDIAGDGNPPPGGRTGLSPSSLLPLVDLGGDGSAVVGGGPAKPSSGDNSGGLELLTCVMTTGLFSSASSAPAGRPPLSTRILGDFAAAGTVALRPGFTHCLLLSSPCDVPGLAGSPSPPSGGGRFRLVVLPLPSRMPNMSGRGSAWLSARGRFLLSLRGGNSCALPPYVGRSGDVLARIDADVPGRGPRTGGRGMSWKLLLLLLMLFFLSSLVGSIHGAGAEATCTAAAAATIAVVLGRAFPFVLSWEDFLIEWMQKERTTLFSSP
ncbi:uncharacterized protein PpBr36_09511 [Pyricularia pennisetigena]|uniref:uncharacterized protein n=1 Tax=Pyricularia pennisetigena TaxID=1578925 RepID=UPI00114FC553|nr:uncharacterized protein PpBr36_09511 [Pyricularia pennisetigena]TLS22088.1 hypothetical protein PpBr36_09511 [Pyricularia pennisetigena]